MAKRKKEAQLRSTDNKGRVSLGSTFANLPVRIEPQGNGEWLIRVVEAIPASEAWLLKNQDALNLVTTGILQAKDSDFAQDPRTGRSYDWLDEIPDDPGSE